MGMRTGVRIGKKYKSRGAGREEVRSNYKYNYELLLQLRLRLRLLRGELNKNQAIDPFINCNHSWARNMARKI